MKIEQYLLLLLSLFFQINFCCEKKMNVRTADNLKEFEVICIECQSDQNYQLNDSYQYCFQTKVSYDPQKIHDCKRLNERFTCQEPRKQCSVLKQNNYSIAQFLSDKCAIITEDLSNCIMPKFGYILILPLNKFGAMDQTFCAVYNSETGKCIKYHHRFLPVLDAGYSVFFKDFFNFDKILHEESHSLQIICEKGYKLEIINGFQGCFSLNNYDKYCKQFNEYKTCVQCIDNYAINAITEKCEKSSLFGCLIQNQQDHQFFCQKCKQGFVLNENECLELKNCAFQSQHPPYKCIACNYPKAGFSCMKEIQIENNKCQIYSANEYFDCLMCINNQQFYGQQCETRQKSLNCKVKHPLYDQCGQLSSKELDFYGLITKQSADQYSFSAMLQQNYKTFSFISFSHYSEYYLHIGVNYSFEVQNYKEITPVEGCLEYIQFEDLCVVCNPDRYLWYYGGIYSCRQEILPSPQQNQIGCQLIDQQTQKCLSCKEKYYLDENYCFPINFEHCLHGSQQSCQKCEEGYQSPYVSDSCEKTQLNCKYMNMFLRDSCEECYSGLFTMITQITKNYISQCIQNVGNCETIINNECKECFYGYTFNVDTKECIKSDKLLDCIQSSNSDECIQCREYYTLIDNQCNPICEQTIPKCNIDKYQNCSECFNERCIKCNNNYTLLQDKCFFKCPNRHFLEDPAECNKNQNQCWDCLECSSQGECQKCINNTYLFFGHCISECPSGYFQTSSNRCEECSQNCLECNSNGCQICESSYQLIEDVCQPLDNNSQRSKDSQIIDNLKECTESECQSAKDENKDDQQDKKVIILICLLITISLLVMITIYLIFKKRKLNKVNTIHLSV